MRSYIILGRRQLIVVNTGMSIGSISSGKTVSGVIFSGNTVSDSLYGTRVKVDSDATSGSVSNVTWSGYVQRNALPTRGCSINETH